VGISQRLSREKVSAGNGCDLLAESPCRRKLPVGHDAALLPSITGPNFPLSSRFTAAQAGFFDLSQIGRAARGVRRVQHLGRRQVHLHFAEF
jgi:hypothetical protein